MFLKRKNKRIFTVVFLAITSLVLLKNNGGAATISYNPSLQKIPLGKHIEFLSVNDANISIDHILTKEYQDKFVKSDNDYPGFGYTSSIYWVRFRIKNETNRDGKWYLELRYPHIDKVNIFIFNEKGRLIDTRNGGDTYPFGDREINYRNIVFKCYEPSLKEQTYYLRFETSGPMNIYLRMWSVVPFLNHVNQMQIIFGLFFGAMLVMLIYNMFIYFSVRDKSYLYYVLYYMFFIIFQLSMNGLAFQYLWPHNTWWVNNCAPPLVFIIIIFAIQFSRYFLQIKKFLGRVDTVLRICMFSIIIILPFSLLLDYAAMLIVAISFSVVMAIALTVISVRILIIGFKPARFYVIAWTAFWIGTVIYSFKLIAVIPDNIITRWIQQIASLFEVILLSLGLADRINYMRSKLQNLNENLEVIVDERTNELNTALKDMKRKDKEVQIESELAGNIQQGILPHTPYYNEGVKVVAFYKSMGKVGGDFYDIFSMKGGHLGILMADASGHGMPAAFITALTKISFSEAIQKYLFPADIFKQVNLELIETIKTDDFVTAFLVVISPNFDLLYSNASHQMALVLRHEEKEVIEWDTNGLFLGALAVANEMYEDRQDALYYGDRVVLYTDGIIEAKNIKDEKFGDDRLKELIVESAHLPLDEAKDTIIKEWMDFTKGSEQNDDVTLLMIEIDRAYKDLVEYRDRGFNHLLNNRYQDAVKVLNKALEINPKDEKTHLYIGECYLKNGDFEKSVEHLNQFLKNNEVDANVWFHLSQAYFNLANYEMALKTSHKASQLRSNFIDAMVISGRSLKNLSRYDEAERIWMKILIQDEDNEIAKREVEGRS